MIAESGEAAGHGVGTYWNAMIILRMKIPRKIAGVLSGKGGESRKRAGRTRHAWPPAGVVLYNQEKHR